MTSRRSVLVVAPFLPWPADFGGALRTYHLIRELAKTNDVMLHAPATSDEWPAARELSQLCDVTIVPAKWTARHPAGRRKRADQLASLARGRSMLEHVGRDPRTQAILDRLFLTRHIDLVQYEFSQTGLYTLPRPCPTIVDAHNIEHTLLQRVSQTSPLDIKRAYNLLEYRRMRALERRAWSRATICVATSALDADVIAAETGAPSYVVPNGVDCAAFDVSRDPTDPPLVLFTGAMRHAPNADAARWYLNEIHPRVTSRHTIELAIVGVDPPSDLLSRSRNEVRVTGAVDDVRPWLAHASVAIVPLLAGGGTRLKILEALAAGVPVVSTTIGAEGLQLTHESDILLADTPAEFAGAILRVLSEPGLAEHLSSQGKERVRNQFDWSVVGESLLAAHAAAYERFSSLGTKE